MYGKLFLRKYKIDWTQTVHGVMDDNMDVFVWIWMQDGHKCWTLFKIGLWEKML
jgi:hypothetical protein